MRDLVSLRFWHRSAWQHCVPVLGEEMAVLWQSSQRLTSYLVPCYHLAFLSEMLPWGWVGLLRPTVNVYTTPEAPHGTVVIIDNIFNCKLKLYCRCIPVRFVLTTQPVFVQGLLEMEFALPTDSTEASGLSLLRRLWVARFDVEEEAQGLAEKYVACGSLCSTCLFWSIIWIIKIRLILYYPPRLWESLGLELVPELCSLLIGDVTHHEEAIRSASAEALSTAVSNYKDQSASVLSQLTQLYHQKLYVRTPRCSNCIKLSGNTEPKVWPCFFKFRDHLLCLMPWAE